MSILSEVYAMGGDAIKNMFEVTFNGLPDGVGGTTDGYSGLKEGGICYRIKTFTVPSVGISTYEVHYKTAKILFPGGKLEYDPKISTELRIDRYWQVYNDLVQWRNYLASPATGAIGMDVASNRCDSIDIKSHLQSKTGSSGVGVAPSPIHGWRFTLCFPMTVPEVAFDYSAGDNISMTVEFGFIEMRDYHAAVTINAATKEPTVQELNETEDYNTNLKVDAMNPKPATP